MQSVTGAPVVDGQAIAGSGRLGIGEWLVTDAVSRARVAVARIGRVDVLPNTRLLEVPDSGHVVYLEKSDVFFDNLKRLAHARTLEGVGLRTA